MQPVPPQPDDLYKAILASLFGPSSFILYVFLLGTTATAWHSWVKSTRKHARDIYASLSNIPAVVRTASAFLALIALALQAAFLGLSFFLAAHLPAAVRVTNGPEDVDVQAWFATTVSPVHDPVFWLWFLIATALVVLAWRDAASADGGIFTFYLTTLLALTGAVTTLVLYAHNKQLAYLAFVYFATAVLALFIPSRSLKQRQRNRAGSPNG